MIISRAPHWAIRVAGLCSCFGLATCGGGDGPSDPGLNLSASSVSFESDLGTVPAPKTVTITTTGEQVTGLTATVSFTGPQDNWLSATFDTENASGSAAATLTLQVTRADLPVGSHAAAIVISSDNAGNSPQVTVAIQVAATDASKMALTTAPPATVRSGEPFTQAPVVQLQNVAGDPVEVAGVQVTVALQGGPALGGTSTVATDAGGAATFGGLSITGLAGQRTLVFQAPGVPDLPSGLIAVQPGDAARIEAISNQAQTKQAGQRVDEPPAVRVTDTGGNPIAGVEVTFEVTDGRGTISTTAPVPTIASGQAVLDFWELGDVAGPNTVTATAVGLTGSPVVFTATGSVGVPTDLTIVSPQNLRSPVNTTITHRVRVTDNTGNDIPGVSVNWEAASGGGSVDQATSPTDNNGVALTVRTLGPAPGTNTTIASATLNGVLKTVEFTVITANGGPAQTVLVAGNNQDGTVGTNLDDQLQVRILDVDGVPQPGVTVAWDILTGDGVGDEDGSFPSGATSPTDVNGLASATWRLGTIAGPQRARASAAGGPVIFDATANPGAPSSANTELTAAPTFFTAGSSSMVTATVLDQFDNPVGGVDVNLSTNASGSFVDATLQTAASGANLGKASTSYTSTAAGNHTITAQIGSFNKTVVIAVQAGVANKMVAVTPTAGEEATFGMPILPADLPAVRVTDASDIPLANVPVTWSLDQGKATVVPLGTTLTNSSGVSALTSWTLVALSAGRDPEFAVANKVTATAGVSLPGGGSPATFTRTVQVSFQNVQTLFGTDAAGTTSGTCLGGGCHIGSHELDLRPDVISGQPISYTELVGDRATRPGTVYVTKVGAPARFDSSAVSSGNIDQNRLLFRLKHLNTGLLQMPPSGERGGTLPANIITIIAAWIHQGAVP